MRTRSRRAGSLSAESAVAWARDYVQNIAGEPDKSTHPESKAAEELEEKWPTQRCKPLVALTLKEGHAS